MKSLISRSALSDGRKERGILATIDFWVTSDGLTVLRAWCRDGLTRKEIADKIGISVRTLYRWEKDNAGIAEALRVGRELTDINVENAILKKALGFEAEEVKTVIKANGDEEITTVRKNVPPDISAASVWLKNRRPEKWRDKPAESNDAVYERLDEIIGEIDAQTDR